tara:strand:+ start:624 stop:770 length:147 start_codon:yes stop_codon:yes gene_type:complete
MDNKNDICITTGPIYSNKANVLTPKTNIKAISLVLLSNPSLIAALKIK